MTPYKRITVQIPAQLLQILNDYARSVASSTDTILVDGLARLTERVLITKSLTNDSFIEPLKIVHDLRMNQSNTYGYDRLSTPSHAERILFDIVTLEDDLIKQYTNFHETPVVITFSQCSRLPVLPAIPRPLIKPMHEARGNTTIHNFVTEAIFCELLHRLTIIETATTLLNNLETDTMTTQEFIPAEPSTETKKLLAEIRELRARLTRLELDRIDTSQNSELITEVLINLVNEAAASQNK